jgi:FGFR1 oncogene partner
MSSISGEEEEKELELKDLIVQSLDANGLLSKIKAQIRASVFIALDENDKNNQNVTDFSAYHFRLN